MSGFRRSGQVRSGLRFQIGNGKASEEIRSGDRGWSNQKVGSGQEVVSGLRMSGKEVWSGLRRSDQDLGDEVRRSSQVSGQARSQEVRSGLRSGQAVRSGLW